eukprot:gnl/Chilomastix_cuspidata/2894.p1 GENE.gnl/Chilomastix_cuspidata/2894~~gnl/Chilomastix_cuspidata/2894.p1  ORF type:complete len:1248 (+),score=516.45 gnl/Chilomastix_cuspidata/2894:1621-5364(+)
MTFSFFSRMATLTEQISAALAAMLGPSGQTDPDLMQRQAQFLESVQQTRNLATIFYLVNVTQPVSSRIFSLQWLSKFAEQQDSEFVEALYSSLQAQTILPISQENFAVIKYWGKVIGTNVFFSFIKRGPDKAALPRDIPFFEVMRRATAVRDPSYAEHTASFVCVALHSAAHVGQLVADIPSNQFLYFPKQSKKARGPLIQGLARSCSLFSEQIVKGVWDFVVQASQDTRFSTAVLEAFLSFVEDASPALDLRVLLTAAPSGVGSILQDTLPVSLLLHLCGQADTAAAALRTLRGLVERIAREAPLPKLDEWWGYGLRAGQSKLAVLSCVPIQSLVAVLVAANTPGFFPFAQEGKADLTADLCSVLSTLFCAMEVLLNHDPLGPLLLKLESFEDFFGGAVKFFTTLVFSPNPFFLEAGLPGLRALVKLSGMLKFTFLDYLRQPATEPLSFYSFFMRIIQLHASRSTSPFTAVPTPQTPFTAARFLEESEWSSWFSVFKGSLRDAIAEVTRLDPQGALAFSFDAVSAAVQSCLGAPNDTQYESQANYLLDASCFVLETTAASLSPVASNASVSRVIAKSIHGVITTRVTSPVLQNRVLSLLDRLMPILIHVMNDHGADDTVCRLVVMCMEALLASIEAFSRSVFANPTLSPTGSPVSAKPCGALQNYRFAIPSSENIDANALVSKTSAMFTRFVRLLCDLPFFVFQPDSLAPIYSKVFELLGTDLLLTSGQFSNLFAALLVFERRHQFRPDFVSAGRTRLLGMFEGEALRRMLSEPAEFKAAFFGGAPCVWQNRYNLQVPFEVVAEAKLPEPARPSLLFAGLHALRTLSGLLTEEPVLKTMSSPALVGLMGKMGKSLSVVLEEQAPEESTRMWVQNIHRFLTEFVVKRLSAGETQTLAFRQFCSLNPGEAALLGIEPDCMPAPILAATALRAADRWPLHFLRPGLAGARSFLRMVAASCSDDGVNTKFLMSCLGLVESFTCPMLQWRVAPLAALLKTDGSLRSAAGDIGAADVCSFDVPGLSPENRDVAFAALVASLLPPVTDAIKLAWVLFFRLHGLDAQRGKALILGPTHLPGDRLPLLISAAAQLFLLPRFDHVKAAVAVTKNFLFPLLGCHLVSLAPEAEAPIAEALQARLFQSVLQALSFFTVAAHARALFTVLEGLFVSCAMRRGKLFDAAKECFLLLPGATKAAVLSLEAKLFKGINKNTNPPYSKVYRLAQGRKIFTSFFQDICHYNFEKPETYRLQGII